MTFMPRVEAVNSAEWPDLVDELDRWEETGRVASLWWRDDDAVAPTPNLYRLLGIAGGAPLALAVIPADATVELASALRWFPQVAVIHHGWCHANHAAAGKKSEYPADRHPVDVADELDEGRKHLYRLFDRRALPVFVPPWNRFAERFVPLLAESGFKAISQMAPRGDNGPRRSIGGLAVIDVDLDVTTWHEERTFIGEAVALGRLVALLRARHEAAENAAIGVLTHHLVMDSATEDFLARLNELVAGHGAARWDDIGGLLT